jgi:uncharacterized membrane protein YeiH
MVGVLMLPFVAANAGGITRVVLIGAVPPVGIADWQNVMVSLVGGLMTFSLHPTIDRLRRSVLVFDAAGLAPSAASGTLTGLMAHLSPLTAVPLGVAALAGAVVAVIGSLLQFPSTALIVAGVALCFVLRMVAIRCRWQLPVARPVDPSSAETNSATEPPASSREGSTPKMNVAGLVWECLRRCLPHPRRPDGDPR